MDYHSPFLLTLLWQDEYSGGSPLLLISVEVISLEVARELGSNNQTTTDSDNGVMYVTYQGERISEFCINCSM